MICDTVILTLLILPALPKTGVLPGNTLPGGTDVSCLLLEAIQAIQGLCGFFPVSIITGTTRQDFWLPLSPKTTVFGEDVCHMDGNESNTGQAGLQL